MFHPTRATGLPRAPEHWEQPTRSPTGAGPAQGPPAAAGGAPHPARAAAVSETPTPLGPAPHPPLGPNQPPRDPPLAPPAAPSLPRSESRRRGPARHLTRPLRCRTALLAEPGPLALRRNPPSSHGCLLAGRSLMPRPWPVPSPVPSLGPRSRRCGPPSCSARPCGHSAPAGVQLALFAFRPDAFASPDCGAPEGWQHPPARLRPCPRGTPSSVRHRPRDTGWADASEAEVGAGAGAPGDEASPVVPRVLP